MKKKALLLMLFFMFISTNAFSQNVIWGYVHHIKGAPYFGAPHEGVSVYVYEFNCGAIQQAAVTTTNRLGQYGFEVVDLPLGTPGARYMVAPEKIGYSFEPSFEWVDVPLLDKYPGDNYCRDNGPCSEGVGDCDGDSTCASGLRCAQDVGAKYGWPSNVDVCEGDVVEVGNVNFQSIPAPLPCDYVCEHEFDYCIDHAISAYMSCLIMFDFKFCWAEQIREEDNCEITKECCQDACPYECITTVR